MQKEPYYNDVLAEIKDFFRERIDMAKSHGIKAERIILDPGIGFGKRLKDNLVLIKHLDYFEDLGRPILLGASRKSFIGRILDLPEGGRLEGTIAASLMGMISGAHILRVHDVEAVKRAVVVAERILNEGTVLMESVN